MVSISFSGFQQIYDILNDKGQWWMARLIRDIPDGDGNLGAEGWVPGTFMDRYYGELEYSDMMFARRKISAEQGGGVTWVWSGVQVTKLDLFVTHSSQEFTQKYHSTNKQNVRIIILLVAFGCAILISLPLPPFISHSDRQEKKSPRSQRRAKQANVSIFKSLAFCIHIPIHVNSSLPLLTTLAAKVPVTTFR